MRVPLHVCINFVQKPTILCQSFYSIDSKFQIQVLISKNIQITSHLGCKILWTSGCRQTWINHDAI